MASGTIRECHAAVRGEHAVIDDLVGLRARDERGEAVEELMRGQAQARGAVGPAGLQLANLQALLEAAEPLGFPCP